MGAGRSTQQRKSPGIAFEEPKLNGARSSSARVIAYFYASLLALFTQGSGNKVDQVARSTIVPSTIAVTVTALAVVGRAPPLLLLQTPWEPPAAGRE